MSLSRTLDKSAWNAVECNGRKLIVKIVKPVIVLFLIFSLSSCAAAGIKAIYRDSRPLDKQYPRMNTLIYEDKRAYEFKNDKTDKLIINIEGSGWISVLGFYDNKKNKMYKSGLSYFIIEAFKNDFTILVPEKLNFEIGANYFLDPDVRQKYYLDNLIESYSEVIGKYLAENDYSKIFLLGSSEGACVLPLLYKKLKENKNIKGMISVAFGGLSWYEQMKILAVSKLDVPEPNRRAYQNIDAYKNDIKLYPKSIGDFGELSYKYWNNILDYKPFNDYKDIDIPVLFIHGEMDINVPVESTRYIQNNIKDKPFEYLYYADMDHTISSFNDKTIKDLKKKCGEWMAKR